METICDAVKLVEDISALGLCHVGHGIPTGGKPFLVFFFVNIIITESVQKPNQMFEDDNQRGLIVVLRCINLASANPPA